MTLPDDVPLNSGMKKRESGCNGQARGQKDPLSAKNNDSNEAPCAMQIVQGDNMELLIVMDFELALRATREKVDKARAPHNTEKFVKDNRLTCLQFWCNVQPFGSQLPGQRSLLARGKVVWGTIIQANEELFRLPYCATDMLGAAIIYSEDPAFDSDPDLLINYAQGMFDTKGKRVSAAMQKLSNKLANERVWDAKIPIPKDFTDGIQCYYAILSIARKHLPENYLVHNFFPVLICPDETDGVTVLPRENWDTSLLRFWSDCVVTE